MIKIIIDWDKVYHNLNRLKCWLFDHKWERYFQGNQKCRVCGLTSIKVTERTTWDMRIFYTKSIEETIRRAGEAFKKRIKRCNHVWHYNDTNPYFPSTKSKICKICLERRDL